MAFAIHNKGKGSCDLERELFSICLFVGDEQIGRLAGGYVMFPLLNTPK